MIPREPAPLSRSSRPVEEPAPDRIHAEPEEHVLLVGEMLHDAKTIEELLRKLPFDPDHYQGNLRTIAAASRRMQQRCGRLMEPDPLKREESTHVHVGPPVAPRPATDGKELTVETLQTAIEELNGHTIKPNQIVLTAGAPRRGRPPKLRWSPPSQRAEAVLSILAKHKPDGLSSGALAIAIGGAHKDTYSALTELRLAGKIKTETIEGNVLNRLP